ncbi:apoptosis regulatory protein Siva-like [Bombina bombina]|uniref:apoptosis regulatory protein Siva-like n=1 Tax=Bombina bombina TaxID=8345 RepID=UPI00235B102C|nr:apoptosis regulatory protein Siva-like [Bombina bombina]
MPKRSYPFKNVSPLQLKTRVGTKELSLGVLGEKYRREIFEKTKNLLFSGAKAFMGNTEHQMESAEERDSNAHALLTGQTIIGHDGKLMRSSSAQKLPPVGVTKACSSCVRSVGDKECCSQCERYVCRNCCKLCSCCSAVTCSFCGIPVENNLSEQVFCSSFSVFEV